MKIEGKVRWFNNKLGYGFITSDAVDNEVFVHYSEIKMKGYKTLNEGDLVSFDLDEELGKAVNVIKIRNDKNTMETA